jgi:tetratricopeptide (TPR) repeat protein
MARDPADRQRSAGELADDLERALADAPEPAGAGVTEHTLPMERTSLPAVSRAAPPPRDPLPATQRGRRGLPSWFPAAAALILLLAVAGIALASLGGGDDSSSSSNSADKAGANDGADKPRRKRREAAATEQPAAAEETAPAEPESSESPAPEADSEVAPVSADPAALNDQGFALMNEGRYDEAIPILQQAVDSFPEGSTDLTYAFALYNLGRSLRLAGRPDEAIPILERRLEIPNQTSTVQSELDAARAAAG